MKIYRSHKVMIGQSVGYEGKRKTVVAVCVSSVMLSDKTWKELQEMSTEELNNQLRSTDGGDYAAWIDLDKVEINGLIVCSKCRKTNCVNNKSCAHCNELL